MTITFQCPNGHRLSCPESQAGKQGKCPKCAAVFRVPQPPESEPAGAPNPFAFLSQDEAPEAARQDQFAPDSESPATGDELEIGEGPAGDDEIVFLCPNGHQLHGPTGLVGRPGQCPVCQVRFLVPSPEDVPDEEEEELIEQDESVSLDEIVINIDAAKAAAPAAAPSLKPAAPPVPPPSGHPLAALFARLWSGKHSGGSIELDLDDGRLLVPDEFAVKHPYVNYGLFGVREPDGSRTLTVVSWDAIHRITVRGLAELPGEWF